jgi:hypothetical protein
VVSLLLATALPCLAEKFHDTPPGGGGGISAAVSPIDELEEVVVVEPTEYKAYMANIDRKGGKFSVQGIPPGKYDLLLKFKTAVAEGITLDVPDDYEKLSEEDRRGIEHVTWISDDFFNDKTIVRMGGNGQRIKMLVEQVRDRRTFNPDGTLMPGVRRIELTEMRKTGRIWTIKKTRHLFRQEGKMSGPENRVKFIHSSKLGSIRVGDEMVTVPSIDLSKLHSEWPEYFYKGHYRDKKFE